MRKTAKAMALLTAASMIMTAFTPVYAESTDDTAAVDWEKGDNIKAIKEKGVITVATGTYVPFEYRDDDNNIVGFDIDLAQYIADKLGVDMEVTDMEFQSIVPSIQNGEYDFSIAAMYKTDERCEVVDMSKSYCDSGMILAVKEDSEYADTIKSLADCDGLKVAVKEGATSYNVAQSFLDENPDVSYEIVQYKDTVGCVSDLLAGRVDVVVNDLLNQKILPRNMREPRSYVILSHMQRMQLQYRKEKTTCLHLSTSALTTTMQTALTMHFGQNGSMLPERERKPLPQQRILQNKRKAEQKNVLL